MPTPLSWHIEAAKILDRENRRMTEPEPRQPATAAGLCDKIRFMDGKRCTRPLGHKGKHYIPYPMRREPAVEAEAAEASGLRAALDALDDEGSKYDDVNRPFGYEDGINHAVSVIRAALAASAEPANEPLDELRMAKALALVNVTDHPISEAIEHWESYRTEATEIVSAYGAVGDLPEYRSPVAGPDAGEPEQRPCPACGALLREDETHWSLFPEPMGGYVCPAPADPEAGR